MYWGETFYLKESVQFFVSFANKTVPVKILILENKTTVYYKEYLKTISGHFVLIF